LNAKKNERKKKSGRRKRKGAGLTAASFCSTSRQEVMGALKLRKGPETKEHKIAGLAKRGPQDQRQGTVGEQKRLCGIDVEIKKNEDEKDPRHSGAKRGKKYKNASMAVWSSRREQSFRRTKSVGRRQSPAKCQARVSQP